MLTATVVTQRFIACIARLCSQSGGCGSVVVTFLLTRVFLNGF